MVVATKSEIKFAKKVEKALKILGIDYNKIKEQLIDNNRVLENVDKELNEAIASARKLEEKRNEIANDIANNFLGQEELR